ncbi:GtrA family protein [Micromonospora sp. NPDC049523]|uniref:GtrA family protein n=1 Tax=Micromonospora sp. NPDC049523 TaxID=3155921 RepID=UPI00342C0455
MRLVRLLPDRWQKFAREAAKFGIVGGLNTIVNFAVFNALVLTVFVNGQLKATVIATVIAATSSYLMNRYWTYRDRPKSAMRREYLLFFLFNTTGLAIELGAVAAAKYGLGIHGLLALNIAKVVGVGVATVFRFWSYRTFVFQPVATHDGGHDHTADGLVELDPVAELAEAVTELEESSHRAPDGHTNGKIPAVEQDLLGVKDDLAAEFADELRAAAVHRPTAH